MTELWAAYAAAFVLGVTHALEVDHMVAVTAFVGGRPRVTHAIAFGVRWGLGHAAVVLIVGTALAATGLSAPRGLVAWLEIAVGVMMVLLGVWALRGAFRLHVHDPESHADRAGHPAHAHLHSHDPSAHPHDHWRADPRRHHRHLPTLVGAVHGLAGAAPVIVLIPVTLIGNLSAAVGYLGVFGIGTVVAMAVYSAAAAAALGRAATTLTALRALAAATAVSSMAVGIVWVTRALDGM